MAYDEQFPHNVRTTNNNRKAFAPVHVTIERVFTNFGTGYSFIEDDSLTGQGRKPIWNMQGKPQGRSRPLPYEGPVYEAGATLEVDLSTNVSGGKTYYNITRAIPITSEEFETPEVETPKSVLTTDARICKGMAFNNLTAIITSGMTEEVFGDNKARVISSWLEAYEATKSGKTPFLDYEPKKDDADTGTYATEENKAQAIAEIDAHVKHNEKVEQPTLPIEVGPDEEVEELLWDAPDHLGSLRAKAVTLMQEKWDQAKDASAEIHKAFTHLPTDWSELTVEQWLEVIAFLEGKGD